MFASFFRALLLVAFVGVVCAHGRVYGLQNKVLVTSSSTAGDAANARRNLLSLDDGIEKDEVSVAARAASSVVQDWSLVCKQLCGAGLGGVPCVAHCSTAAAAVNEVLKTAAAILHPSKDLICQDLCGLQLGGSACNCTVDAVEAAAPPVPANADHNAVCSSFCDRNGATLDGCSLCRHEINVRPSALTAGGVDAENVKDGGVGAYVDFVAPTTAAAPIITTTPNWDVLCVSLCKTGDGGSLCNCDLSPFFK